MTEGTCSVEGCERPAVCRGPCASHYRRYRQTGVIGGPIRPLRKPDEMPVPSSVPCAGGCGELLKRGPRSLLAPTCRACMPVLADRACSIGGCDRPAHCKGWCKPHYARWQRHGDPMGAPPRPTPEQRFASKWELEPVTGCWRWTGTVMYAGYGVLRIDGRNHRAHRWSYEHHVGPIPAGLELDHLCRNRACVNPLHLEPVTARENQRRSNSPSGINAAKTECIHGHDLTDPDNVSLYRGSRRCVACRRLWDRNARMNGKKPQ